jgi:hypothetical protein
MQTFLINVLIICHTAFSCLGMSVLMPVICGNLEQFKEFKKFIWKLSFNNVCIYYVQLMLILLFYYVFLSMLVWVCILILLLIYVSYTVICVCYDAFKPPSQSQDLEQQDLNHPQIV